LVRKDVAVLAKKPAIVSFLEVFFRETNMYRALFFNTSGKFLRHSRDFSPSVVIADCSFLKSICLKKLRCEIIIILDGNKKTALREAINSGAKRYISAPYLNEELHWLLASAAKEKKAAEKIAGQIKGLESVVEFIQMILTTREPDEILFKIVEKISEIMPVSRCSLIRIDKGRKSATVLASFESREAKGTKLDLAKYPEIRASLRERKSILVRDVMRTHLMKDVRDLLAPVGIHSILVLPIFFHNKIIGTLFLRTSRKRYNFSNTEVRCLQSIANAVSSALLNTFLLTKVEGERQRLAKLSITDYLTGLFNIRYLYQRLKEEFERCKRYSIPLSFIMLDLDDFKKINDEKGHSIGDKVLMEFARILRTCSRRTDLLARYGGDEFVILLPQTSLNDAVLHAERIVQLLKDHRFSSLKNMEGMTVSIGISAYPHDEITTYSDLVKLADHLLLKAKDAGKNRIVTHDTSFLKP